MKVGGSHGDLHVIGVHKKYAFFLRVTISPHVETFDVRNLNIFIIYVSSVANYN